jgi:hypothetical protein
MNSYWCSKLLLWTGQKVLFSSIRTFFILYSRMSTFRLFIFVNCYFCNSLILFYFFIFFLQVEPSLFRISSSLSYCIKMLIMHSDIDSKRYFISSDTNHIAYSSLFFGTKVLLSRHLWQKCQMTCYTISLLSFVLKIRMIWQYIKFGVKVPILLQRS